jgi:hypothetical protein
MNKAKKIIFYVFLVGVCALALNSFIKSPAYSQSQSDINSAIGRVKLENTPVPTKASTPYVVTDVLAGHSASGQWVQQLYNICRGILNILLVVVLLVIAFANILHINIETYAIKKMLPKIIIAAVVANLAMIIFTLGSGVIDRLQGLSLFKPRLLDFTYITGGMWAKSGWLGAAALIASFIITGGISGLACGCAFIIFFGSAIITILLGLILAFRPYVVFLAAAVSPLAIACYILPQTQSFFKKWFNIAVVWLFMPLVVYGIMNIGDLIPSSTGAVAGAGGFISWLVGTFLPILLRAGLLLLAIRFPFMVEKDISGLIARVGKLTGAGIVTGGASLGNTVYQLDKTKLQGALSNARAAIASSGFNGQDEASKQKFIEQKTKALSYEKENEGKSEDELKQIAERDWGSKNEKERKREFEKNMIGNAFRSYTASPTSKWITGIGAVASMPLGIIEGLKINKELMAKERSKQAQKLLFRNIAGADKWLGQSAIKKGLEEKLNLKGLITFRTLFDPEGVRGHLGELKYFEAIAADDLKGNLSVDQISEYLPPDAMPKIRKNAAEILKRVNGGRDPNEDEINKFIKAQFENLYIRAENVGTWADQDLMRGIKNMDVANIKTCYGRIREQALRHTSYVSGQERRNFAELDADRVLFGEDFAKKQLYDKLIMDGRAKDPKDAEKLVEETFYRRAGRPGGGARGGSEVDETGKPLAPTPARRSEAELGRALEGQAPTTELDPKALNYLEQIASQTKGLNGLESFKNAVSLAQQHGITEAQAGAFGRKSEDLLGLFVGHQPKTRFTEQEMRRFAHVLEAEGPGTLGSRVEQIKTQVNNPDVAKTLDEYYASRMAHLGALANTEQAQSVQRFAVDIAPKLSANPALAQQLQQACNIVVEAKLNLRPNISPQELSAASKLIGENIPGAVKQVSSATGETSYDVSEGIAAKLARSIQALIIE